MLGAVTISGTESAFSHAMDKELKKRMEQANLQRDFLMAQMYQDGIKSKEAKKP